MHDLSLPDGAFGLPPRAVAVARMTPRAAGIALMFIGSLAHGQDYRLRIDARAQSIWFRGLEQDSIPAGDAVATGSAASYETRALSYSPRA